MNGGHADIGPELRRLAQAILDGIDPAVRAAAALTAGAGDGTGKCQQVWCPVCALAALATGEEHPLLTVIADQSVALVDMIRRLIDDIDRSAAEPRHDGPPDDGPPDGAPPDGGGPPAGADGTAGAKTRYQPIAVTVEE